MGLHIPTCFNTANKKNESDSSVCIRKCVGWPIATRGLIWITVESKQIASYTFIARWGGIIIPKYIVILIPSI